MPTGTPSGDPQYPSHLFEYVFSVILSTDCTGMRRFIGKKLRNVVRQVQGLSSIPTDVTRTSGTVIYELYKLTTVHAFILALVM